MLSFLVLNVLPEFIRFTLSLERYFEVLAGCKDVYTWAFVEFG